MTDAYEPEHGRQRVIIVTFATVEQAEQWDAAGQPIAELEHLHKIVIE